MELVNGYKLIYQEGKDLFASTTGFPANDDAKLDIPEELRTAKLIYEKDGKFYGSMTGIPSEDDIGVVIKADGRDVFGDPSIPDTTPSYAEAVKVNIDSYTSAVDVSEDGKVASIIATGTVKYLKSATGKYGNWVGFKLTLPEGIAAENVIITRPNGTTTTFAKIADDAAKTYSSIYWNFGKQGTSKVADYLVDWTGNGQADLTVRLDVTGAELEPKPVTE